jgi:H+/gluconate symporter-like permease
MDFLTLKAVYTAPGATQTFQHAVPTPTSTSNADPLAAKQSHLTALQSLVPQLQDQVNVFLTARMEEDKGKISEEEAKEEENYGEEVVEDDA